MREDGINLNENERTRCEVWTRVMGYHRPTTSFNIGKQGEHAERTPFVEARAIGAMAEPAEALA